MYYIYSKAKMVNMFSVNIFDSLRIEAGFSVSDFA